MAKEVLRLTRPKIVNGRVYGPGDHEIQDREVSRQLRTKGALRVTGEGSKQTAVKAAAPENVSELTGEIPDGFPYRKALTDNNVTTLDQLVAMKREELTQLDGIAELSADKIEQGLNDLVAELQEAANEG